MVTSMEFGFDPELPEDWILSFEEVEPFLRDLPVDSNYGREEMLNAYRQMMPTKDLTCCVLPHSENVHADISGDKDRLIWAKWRLAVAEAIGKKYDCILCMVKFDGRNFAMRDLWCDAPPIESEGQAVVSKEAEDSEGGE